MTYSPDIVQNYIFVGRVWTGYCLGTCIGLPTVGASCYGLEVEADNCVIEHVLVALRSWLLLVAPSLEHGFSPKPQHR